MQEYRIAVVPGDGIGREVVPEGQRVLEAAGRRFGISFRWEEYPWGCEYYAREGRMMPEDGIADPVRTAMRYSSARWGSRECRITSPCGGC